MNKILILLLLSAPLCAMKRVPEFTKEDFAVAQQLAENAKKKKEMKNGGLLLPKTIELP